MKLSYDNDQNYTMNNSLYNVLVCRGVTSLVGVRGSKGNKIKSELGPEDAIFSTLLKGVQESKITGSTEATAPEAPLSRVRGLNRL